MCRESLKRKKAWLWLTLTRDSVTQLSGAGEMSKMAAIIISVTKEAYHSYNNINSA